MKEISDDLNHNLTFYYSYNPLYVAPISKVRSVFRVLRMYNFGAGMHFLKADAEKAFSKAGLSKDTIC